MSGEGDKESIDAVTKAFFGVFSNRDGGCPNLSALYELFVPGGLILKTCGDAVTVYSLPEFIEPRARLFSEGGLREFSEEESAERTDVFGSVAQRFCSYRKSGVLDGERFEAKGMKCLQFVKSSGRWLLSSVAWDDERDGNLVSM
ncbi:MAG: DUF4440 domain-containing protein [Acidobacteria bacterium]|nr:DUF4440 domain-containing protein [Acidobacteriota bacterium]